MRAGKAGTAIGLVLAGALSAHCAPAATMVAYDIPSQDLGAALDRFAEQSGQRTIVAASHVERRMRLGDTARSWANEATEDERRRLAPLLAIWEKTLLTPAG